VSKCKECDTKENIVWSGIDAWILGCLDDITNICYECANKNNNKNVEQDAKLVLKKFICLW
jgi:hypothetical protein